MRSLRVLALRVAVAEAVVFLFALVLVGGAVRLLPGQWPSIVAGCAGTWALQVAVALAGIHGFGRPLARALDAPAGPIDLALAQRAVRTAMGLPGRISWLLLGTGAAGASLTVAYAFLGLEVPPDLDAAALALGLGVAVAGAMAGYLVLATRLPPLAAQLELPTDERPPGSLRQKIVFLGVATSGIAVLLISSVAYLQHRWAVYAEQERIITHLVEATMGAPGGSRSLADAAREVARDVGAPVAILADDGAVFAEAGSPPAHPRERPQVGSRTIAGRWTLTRQAGGVFINVYMDERPIVARLRPVARSLLVAALVAFVAAAALSWFAATAVTLPFRDLGVAADRIAEGDLTVNPASVSADEMGRLAAQFRRMAQGLTGLVREVQNASENVSTGAIEATAIGERVRRGALEQHEGVRAVQSAVGAMEGSVALVGRGLGGLSEYVSATTRAVGEMARAFEEVQGKAAELERAMGAAVSEVEGLGTAGRDAEGKLTTLESLAARSGGTLAEVKTTVDGLERAAGESEATAAAVAEAADRAGVVMEGTVHGIETLRGAVADAHERIAALGRRSDDIDKVVDFISEVAGRTNLLSLNASIIASQAGEHGKAFAVVADQIRELASQIARSTKSIGDIIHAVRDDVDGTAALIDRGDALAVEGVQLARNSVEALSDVRRSTSRGRDTAAAIRSAVQAHARSTREVSHLVELVADGSRAVTSAVQLVGRSVGGVHSVSRGVTGMADRVARALEEQSGLGRRQLENLSRLEAMIQEITRAVEDHNAATQAVKRALEALSHTAGEHESAVHGLSGVADQIGSRAKALSERVNRFKV